MPVELGIWRTKFGRTMQPDIHQLDRLSTPARPVLVVDDDSNDVFLLSLNLRRAGITDQVLHLNGFEQALRFFETNLPDTNAVVPWVGFLDVRMPCGGGFEILRWIRERPYSSRIPFVILSGAAEPRDLAMAAELSVDRYLLKPAPVAALIEIAAKYRPQPWQTG